MKPMLIAATLLFVAPVLAQDAMAPAAMPMCSAKVKDSCMQTPSQQARAMSGAQADARDAKSGMWTPDGSSADKSAMAMPMMKKHRMHKKAAKPMADMPMAAEAAPK
jgi:hypothetical protein